MAASPRHCFTKKEQLVNRKSMTVELQIYPEPVLREACTAVDQFDSKLHELLDDMHKVMYKENGIGLAANQVGVLKRLFIADVSPMFTPEHIEKYGQPTEWDKNLIEFMNPQIVSKEGEIVWSEGCLSLPTIFYEVTRAQKIVIRAQDRFGKPFEVEAKNILAVCCQHEYDHLDGNIFLDYVSQAKRQSALTKLKKIKKNRIIEKLE
jgi:peptide deformylase